MIRLQLAPPPIGVSGRYRLTAHKLDGSSRVLAEFDNIITDIGLNRLGRTNGTTEAPDYYCSVGTGNAAPAITDTGLQTHRASTTTRVSTSVSNTAVATYYSQVIIKYRFGVGAASGNISEVGIGWASAGINLFSRALILNELGNPTTITVLGDEYLDVEYSFRVYPPTGDVTGTKTISGSNYDYVMRATAVTNTAYWNAGSVLSAAWGSPVGQTYNGNASAIGANIAALPTGETQTPENINDTGTYAGYVDNSLERSATYGWGITKGNYNSPLIGAIRWTSHGNAGVSYQISFTPRLPKDITDVLSLTFKTSWARRP